MLSTPSPLVAFPQASVFRRTWWGAALALLCLLSGLGTSAWAADPRVTVLEVRGPITPVMATYVERAVNEANEQERAAIVLELDTPGGLDSAMRDIVKHTLNSRVPVIGYVSPHGARAASAGMYILMAAGIAAMAPETALGAASPVGSGGEEIGATMKKKVTNDAAAFMRSLAVERGRNAAWAERAVREAVSASANEALKLHVIDLIAPDLPTLLDQLDGKQIKAAGQTVQLQTRHALLDRKAMTTLENLLQTLANPSIALLLLNLGMLGLFFELSNPGLIVPGVIGAVFVLLAAFSMGMLPINATGVALIAFAFLCFVAELFVPAFGALAIGGVISLVLGALMLIAPGTPGFEVSRPLIATIALTSGALIAAMVMLAVKAQRSQVSTGSEGLIGMIAEVRVPLEPEGQVFLNGELWRAISQEGPVAAGARVKVLAVDHLTLHVVPLPLEGA